MHRSPRLSDPASTRILGLLLLPLLLVGCSGGSTYSLDQSRIAERFLPTERTVSHHPDSLGALTITEGDDKIQYQLERDFESLVQKWSCRYQSVGTGRPFQSRTFATFWSLELSLVSLQPEMGVLSLQKERARELIEERRQEASETIHIDVYWFVERRGETGIITGPRARTVLHVQDSTYRPIQTDHGPLREAFVTGGDVVLYRRNTLYFPRTVDDTDILADASGMELMVRRSGAGMKEEFAWQWGNE